MKIKNVIETDKVAIIMKDLTIKDSKNRARRISISSQDSTDSEGLEFADYEEEENVFEPEKEKSPLTNMFRNLATHQSQDTIKFNQSDDSRDPPSNKNLLPNMDDPIMDLPDDKDAEPQLVSSQDNKIDLDDLYVNVKQEDNNQMATMQVTPTRKMIKPSRPSSSKGTPRPQATPKLRIQSVKRFFPSISVHMVLP